jgi:hypothetical protein
LEAGTVPEKAVISHRGEKYEIGRGKRFYGIWVVGAPYEAPVDRWPENPAGWHQAWARFTAIEVPGTITAVTPERKLPRLGLRRTGSGPAETAEGEPAGKTGLIGKVGASARPGRGSALLAGEALLVFGVVLGLAGLFPAYDGSQSLLSQWDQVVPHLCYVIGWAVAAALIALSAARPGNAARTGALFGLGLSAVTFGLFLADLGEVLAGGVTLGTGLVVSMIGWFACTVGSALALRSAGPRTAEPGTIQYGAAGTGAAGTGTAGTGTAGTGTAGTAHVGQGTAVRPAGGRPTRPGPGHVGPLLLLVLAAVGTAASFAPAWDRYILTSSVQGTSQTVTAGNAFDNPGWVIAGDVAVMVAVIAVAALAGLWRPARQGALLLAGAILPLATQAVSALIQAGQQPTPAMFQISDAQASALGLTISSGLTGIFWVYFVFVISLLVTCAWLFTEPEHPAMAGIPASPWLAPGGEAGTRDAAGAAVSEDADSDESDDVSADDTDSDGGTEDGEQSAYA